MTTIIVDTSVAVKWYSETEEKDLNNSSKIRELVLSKQYLLVCPKIITLELINTFKFSKKMSPEDCLASIKSFANFCTNLTDFPNPDQIIDLMYKHDLTGYDAAFVALANIMQVPLITADYKHHKKEISPNIVWLKEWKEKF